MTHQNLYLPYTFNFHIAHITYKNEESKHFLKILVAMLIAWSSWPNPVTLVRLWRLNPRQLLVLEENATGTFQVKVFLAT